MAIKPIPYRVPMEPYNYNVFQFVNAREEHNYYIVIAEARRLAYIHEVSVTYYNWRSRTPYCEGTLTKINILKWSDLTIAIRTELKKQNAELYMQFETCYLYQLQQITTKVLKKPELVEADMFGTHH